MRLLACLHVDTCLLGMHFLGVALCPKLDEMDMIDCKPACLCLSLLHKQFNYSLQDAAPTEESSKLYNLHAQIQQNGGTTGGAGGVAYVYMYIYIYIYICIAVAWWVQHLNPKMKTRVTRAA